MRYQDKPISNCYPTYMHTTATKNLSYKTAKRITSNVMVGDYFVFSAERKLSKHLTAVVATSCDNCANLHSRFGMLNLCACKA